MYCNREFCCSFLANSCVQEMSSSSEFSCVVIVSTAARLLSTDVFGRLFSRTSLQFENTQRGPSHRETPRSSILDEGLPRDRYASAMILWHAHICTSASQTPLNRAVAELCHRRSIIGGAYLCMDVFTHTRMHLAADLYRLVGDLPKKCALGEASNRVSHTHKQILRIQPMLRLHGCTESTVGETSMLALLLWGWMSDPCCPSSICT